jgi:hypothetical protein
MTFARSRPTELVHVAPSIQAAVASAVQEVLNVFEQACASTGFFVNRHALDRVAEGVS